MCRIERLGRAILLVTVHVNNLACYWRGELIRRPVREEEAAGSPRFGNHKVPKLPHKGVGQDDTAQLNYFPDADQLNWLIEYTQMLDKVVSKG